MTAPSHSWTLVDAIRRQAETHRERPFVSFELGDPLSFAGLDRESDRLAHHLAALGVEPGDRVMGMSRNRQESLLMFAACMKRGAIWVPINVELKGDFLEHQVNNADPKVLLVESDLLNLFVEIKMNAWPAAIIVVGGEVPDFMGSRATTFEDWAARTDVAPVPLADPAPSDIACIMYTSGTTGPSKGVMMPHAHCYGAAHINGLRLGLTDRDRYYICMPLFHMNGLFVQLFGTLLSGGCAHVAKEFSASRWIEEARAHGATVANLLGVMPEFVLKQPAAADDADNTLTRVMTVPVDEGWAVEFEKRFGLRIIQGYGMTECNMPAMGNMDQPLQTGLAGPVLRDLFDLEIHDPETDEPLHVGEVGEIVVRPRHPHCFMAGYYNMPQKTVESWRNLWFHTGDLGRLDVSDRLHFLDRMKDAIRRRGTNISAFELEKVLNDHPSVAESAVVGIKVADAGGEEEIKAVLVAIDGQDIHLPSLMSYCQERLPRYAVPRFIEVVTDLPRTPAGKIHKQALRDAGVTAQIWDREAK